MSTMFSPCIDVFDDVVAGFDKLFVTILEDQKKFDY